MIKIFYFVYKYYGNSPSLIGNFIYLAIKINSMQDKIFEMLFDKDEITWQTVISELIKTEQIDPWDIDVSLLTHKYIEMIKTLKEMDFKISGKVLLASAILLKIKSNKLVGEDILEFDKLIEGADEDEIEDLYEDTTGIETTKDDGPISLIPRTPQPRKRKVSISDLMNALEKALEVKKRRVMQDIPPMDVNIPAKTKNITQILRDIYGKIRFFFLKGRKNRMTFSHLVPSGTKEDKIYTFVPLLHLTSQQKIDLHQEKHFGEIEIILKNKQEIEKELGAE